MAFIIDKLSNVVSSNIGTNSVGQWIYRTTDDRTTVLAANYFVEGYTLVRDTDSTFKASSVALRTVDKFQLGDKISVQIVNSSDVQQYQFDLVISAISYDGASPSLTVIESTEGWSLIETATASSSSSIDFIGLNSSHSEYKVSFSNVLVSTDGTYFMLRTSSDNGATFDSTASDYKYHWMQLKYEAGVYQLFYSASDTALYLTSLIDTGGGYKVSGEITIRDPSLANATQIDGMVHFPFNTDTVNYVGMGGGMRDEAAAVNAIRFMADTGTLTTGNFYLYGLIKR